LPGNFQIDKFNIRFLPYDFLHFNLIPFELNNVFSIKYFDLSQVSCWKYFINIFSNSIFLKSKKELFCSSCPHWVKVNNAAGTLQIEDVLRVAYDNNSPMIIFTNWKHPVFLFVEGKCSSPSSYFIIARVPRYVLLGCILDIKIVIKNVYFIRLQNVNLQKFQKEHNKYIV